MSVISSYFKICNHCKANGKEILYGYRNLNLIASTAPECIRPRTGAFDFCPNCILLGPSINFGGGDVPSRILIVDCFMGKIKLNEQKLLQITKRLLQNTKTITRMKKR